MRCGPFPREGEGKKENSDRPEDWHFALSQLCIAQLSGRLRACGSVCWEKSWLRFRNACAAWFNSVSFRTETGGGTEEKGSFCKVCKIRKHPTFFGGTFCKTSPKPSQNALFFTKLCQNVLSKRWFCQTVVLTKYSFVKALSKGFLAPVYGLVEDFLSLRSVLAHLLRTDPEVAVSH